MELKKYVVEMRNGLRVINSTPHPIKFLYPDGEEEIIPAGEKEVIQALTASPEEHPITQIGEVEFIKTVWKMKKEAEEILEWCKKNGIYIIGSAITLQAFNSPFILGLTPAPGYERVSPQEKRMNPYKFNIAT